MKKPFNGNYTLTQEWGVNPNTYARFGLRGHNGLDHALPNNTKILAPHAGKILEVAYDKDGYGNYVKIESSLEGSVLAHLDRFAVQIGEQVNEGQLIGFSDNTGFSTGPHLHWGYYKIPRNRDNGYLGYINQLPLLVTQVPMDEVNNKKLVQFDKACIELNKAKYAPTPASEYWFENPADPDKFANMIKQLLIDAKAKTITSNLLAECEKKCQNQKEGLIAKIIEFLKKL